MRIASIAFKEYPGAPQEWYFDEVVLDAVSLVVGRNASGKTRFLNVIAGLKKMINGEIPVVFESGHYRVNLVGPASSYRYELDIQGGEVRRELLARNGYVVIDRGADGSGKIWAERLNQQIDFETPKDVIAARVRRDAIQHPFLQELYEWAALVRHFQFGTPLGRDRLFLQKDLAFEQQKTNEPFDASAVVRIYKLAYDKFGGDLDAAILGDLALLGYECEDIGAMPLSLPGVAGGAPVFSMFVKEKNLTAPVTQLTMSAGMFRALALVVHINDCVFRQLPCTLLIDDIGEGLDFSRSRSVISLLIERAESNGMQVIMTTNDRFVMNDIPLKYWAVIQREGGNVRLINIKNSPKIFADFEDLGLNNFDFFATGFFGKGLL